MTTFEEMRKNSGKLGLQKLQEEIEKLSHSTYKKSDLYWEPTIDKDGSGFAIIRFLPAPQGESVPFVRLFTHAFKGPNGWYIENSRTTLGDADPCTEYNSMLWNKSTDDKSPERIAAREQKRKLYYISNIYVIKDSGNPENNGKVFLFKYGKQIFSKINNLSHPKFEDEDAIDPFDLWTGANFKLKIVNENDQRTYNYSAFDTSSPLFDDDDKIKAVWESEHSLQAEIAPDKFKSYEELATRLRTVLMVDSLGEKMKASDSRTLPQREMKSTPAKEPARVKVSVQEDEETTDDNDDVENFFNSLSEDD